MPRQKKIDYYEDDDDYDDDYDDDDDYYDKPVARSPAPSSRPQSKATAKPKITPKAPTVTKLKPAASKPQKSSESQPNTVSSSSPGQITVSDQLPSMKKTAVAEEDDGKGRMSLVVCGHVDSGKSTLMGHLLLHLGVVTEQALRRFEKEATPMGKASFKYAWFLDEGSDERSHGVTIDICIKHFETEKKKIVVVDTPGHRDFLPAMVSGAMLADAAILVVDARDFEKGFHRGGQTREHIQLLRALGVLDVIVAVNKMDAVLDGPWNRARFEDIVGQIRSFMVDSCLFKAERLRFIPLSAWTGANLIGNVPEELSWYSGPDLIDALDAISVPKPPMTPLRVLVVDTFHSSNEVRVTMKVVSGTLSSNMHCLLLPANTTIVVKLGSVQGKSNRRTAYAGEVVDVAVLANCDRETVWPGSVLVSSGVVPAPASVVTSFFCRLLVFGGMVPLVPGQMFEGYVHAACLSVKLNRIVTLLGPRGNSYGKSPKSVAPGQSTIVHMSILDGSSLAAHFPVAGESGVSCLSRIVLRARGLTVAAGVLMAEEAGEGGQK